MAKLYSHSEDAVLLLKLCLAIGGACGDVDVLWLVVDFLLPHWAHYWSSCRVRMLLFPLPPSPRKSNSGWFALACFLLTCVACWIYSLWLALTTTPERARLEVNKEGQAFLRQHWQHREERLAIEHRYGRSKLSPPENVWSIHNMITPPPSISPFPHWLLRALHQRCPRKQQKSPCCVSASSVFFMSNVSFH